MNLVLGAIYGYDWEKVKHFVISLRKHYKGKVGFIVDQNIINNKELKQKLLDTYDIDLIVYEEKLQSNHEIQNNRFELYSDIINEYYNDVEKVFITDVRDVIFQDDPFSYGFDEGQELEFYYEPELIGNCRCNSWWYRTMFGEEVLNQVKDKIIICCGTIMGTREGLLKYLELFKQEFKNMRDNGRIFTGGEDTVIHNLLVYNDKIPMKYKITHNGEGVVSTLDHQKTFTFDGEGRYINNDGRPTPVIHQWDRVKQHIDLFNKIALE